MSFYCYIESHGPCMSGARVELYCEHNIVFSFLAGSCVRFCFSPRGRERNEGVEGWQEEGVNEEGVFLYLHSDCRRF